MRSVAFEHRKVLVLNKNYSPHEVTPLHKALSLLFSWYSPTPTRPSEPKALIYDAAIDFKLYTWEDWSRMKVPDTEDCIHAYGGKRFRIPEIIRLTRFDRVRKQRVNFSRKTIYKRDNFTCQYCGCRPGATELTIDHVLPRAQGGTTTWENCVLACVQCNSQKADRRPEQAYKNSKTWRGPSPMKLLSVPKKPEINLFKDEKMYVPKTWSQFVSAAYWDVELQNDNK